MQKAEKIIDSVIQVTSGFYTEESMVEVSIGFNPCSNGIYSIVMALIFGVISFKS